MTISATQISKKSLYLTVIVLLSFCQLIYNLHSNSNFDYSISEQAFIDGSDQYTIYKWSDLYKNKKGSFITFPPKYMLTTLLISNVSNEEDTSNIILPIIKWLYFVLAALFITSVLNNYTITFGSNLFFTYLVLNPLLNAWHPLLLRDDLIIASFLICIGFSIRIIESINVKSIDKKLVAKKVVGFIIYVMILMLLRPELAAILILFQVVVIYFHIGYIKKIIYALTVVILIISFREDFFKFFAHSLLNFGYTLSFIHEAIRAFHFSPAPWNIIQIATKEINSDSYLAWQWFYISFFTSFFIIMSWFVLVVAKFIRIEYKSVITTYFLFLPLLIDILYGLSSESLARLGPRQGAMTSALLFYFFCVPVVSNYLIYISKKDGRKISIQRKQWTS